MKTYIPIVVAGDAEGSNWWYMRADTRQAVDRCDIAVLTDLPVFCSKSVLQGFSEGIPRDSLSLRVDKQPPEANAVLLSRDKKRRGNRELYAASFCVLTERR